MAQKKLKFILKFMKKQVIKNIVLLPLPAVFFAVSASSNIQLFITTCMTQKTPMFPLRKSIFIIPLLTILLSVKLWLVLLVTFAQINIH